MQLRPRDTLLADHIAKLTPALDADAFQPHWHRQLLTAIIEQ